MCSRHYATQTASFRRTYMGSIVVKLVILLSARVAGQNWVFRVLRTCFSSFRADLSQFALACLESPGPAVVPAASRRRSSGAYSRIVVLCSDSVAAVLVSRGTSRGDRATSHRASLAWWKSKQPSSAASIFVSRRTSLSVCLPRSLIGALLSDGRLKVVVCV